MTEQFTIYHGGCGTPYIEHANETAPEFRHGHCWTPQKQTPNGNPWILDNGVYSAWTNGVDWDADAWLQTLTACREKMPTDPDFVILPDAVGDSATTYRQSREYADVIPAGWPRALAVQDGMNPNKAVSVARELDCDYLFVGGTIPWKRRHAEDFIAATTDIAVDVHIARPSLPGGVLWAQSIGAVSCDTTTIAVTPDSNHLERIAGQTQLSNL